MPNIIEEARRQKQQQQALEKAAQETAQAEALQQQARLEKIEHSHRKFIQDAYKALFETGIDTAIKYMGQRVDASISLVNDSGYSITEILPDGWVIVPGSPAKSQSEYEWEGYWRSNYHRYHFNHPIRFLRYSVYWQKNTSTFTDNEYDRNAFQNGQKILRSTRYRIALSYDIDHQITCFSALGPVVLPENASRGSIDLIAHQIEQAFQNPAFQHTYSQVEWDPHSSAAWTAGQTYSPGSSPHWAIKETLYEGNGKFPMDPRDL